MADYKIIFAGPVGAGKTTAICAMSDTPPVRTDENASDMTVARKPQTTVALDYGTLHLASGECVHLYGTPGQERFDFMWEILAEGALGVVVLLDNTRPNPLADLQFFADSFAKLTGAKHLALGVTRMDIQPEPSLDFYRDAARKLELNVPVFEVDARERKDVSVLLRALLYSIDPALKTNGEGANAEEVNA